MSRVNNKRRKRVERKGKREERKRVKAKERKEEEIEKQRMQKKEKKSILQLLCKKLIDYSTKKQWNFYARLHFLLVIPLSPFLPFPASPSV